VSDRDAPGLGGTADPFSSLLGSGAQPGGAGGLDLADLTGTVQRLLDDPTAMAALRGYLDEGRDLRPALEATAETVPSAAPAIERLLANPGVVDSLGSALGDLIGGGSPTASGEGGPDADALPGILGSMLGGSR
jgi:hypothetical protein